MTWPEKIAEIRKSIEKWKLKAEEHKALHTYMNVYTEDYEKLCDRIEELSEALRQYEYITIHDGNKPMPFAAEALSKEAP